MSKEQLLIITRNQSVQLKKLHKQVKRLEKHRENMSEVGEKTNTDLICMFEQLNIGLVPEGKGLRILCACGKGVVEKDFQMLNVFIIM